MGVHTLCFLCMRLEACNCIPSHTPFTPLQFRIVCHCIQLRERLFRLLLIAESSPSSHTACLSSQTMRLPSQAHGLGLRIIASHCNKHLPIAYRCFPSHQALFPLRIIVSHCNDLPIIASHHNVPLGFCVSTNLRTFGKWAVSPASKRLLGIRAVCNLRLLGILKIWSICAGFGTFEDFDENLLWARSARHLTTHTSLCTPSSWLVR